MFNIIFALYSKIYTLTFGLSRKVLRALFSPSMSLFTSGSSIYFESPNLERKKRLKQALKL